MNPNMQRRSGPRRPTFRNHPVPNRYEYMHPGTGHFSDGADLLTDTDTSVDGGGPGGENYWQMQKPLLLSTFRPISASSSSRLSPNPNNSDMPASSISSNSQQPSPNYNFSPESLIPSSFVIPLSLINLYFYFNPKQSCQNNPHFPSLDHFALKRTLRC